MAFNLPSAVALHTITAGQNVGTVGILGGSGLTLSAKDQGNLPITSDSSRMNYNGASSATGPSAGVFFGFNNQVTLGDIDLTSNKTLFIWSLQFNAPNRIQVTDVANGGIRFFLGSGSEPENNYREWFIGGNDTPFGSAINGPVTICIDLADLSYDNEVGTFDQTNVTAYGCGVVRFNLGGNGQGILLYQRSILLSSSNVDTDTYVTPSFTGASSFDDAIALVQGSDYTNKIGNWATKSGTSIFLPVPFSIGDGSSAVSFNDNGQTIISPASNATNQENFRLTNDAMRVYLDTRDNSLDTVILSGSYSWGTAAEWNFDISNASTCTLSGAFKGMGNFTLGSSVTASGTFSLASNYIVVCNGANIDNCTINGDLKLKGSTTSSLTDVSANNLEFDTAGTYQLTKCDISSVTNTSGGTVIIENVDSTIGTNLDPTIIIRGIRTISITNIVAGSRMQIFNTTTGLEVNNEIVVGTDYIATYADGTGFSLNDVIRVRLMYTNATTSYDEFETTAIASSTGWSVLATQIVDTIYTNIGLDGTGVTKFSADYAGNDVNLNINQNFEIGEFYAWWKYNLFLSQGISDFYGVLTALDDANFRINNTILDFYLDSIANASVRQLDNRRIYRADLAYPVRQPTTNGFGLDVVWRNIIFVVPVEKQVSALTSAQSTQLGNITDVLADTNELQTNQGNFATATGFSTFDSATDEVKTDEASRQASKADVDQALVDYNVDTKTNVKPSIPV